MIRHIRRIRRTIIVQYAICCILRDSLCRRIRRIPRIRRIRRVVIIITTRTHSEGSVESGVSH